MRPSRLLIALLVILALVVGAVMTFGPKGSPGSRPAEQVSAKKKKGKNKPPQGGGGGGQVVPSQCAMNGGICSRVPKTGACGAPPLGTLRPSGMQCETGTQCYICDYP